MPWERNSEKGEQLFKPIIYTESHVIAEHTTPQMEIPCSPVRGSHIVQTKNVSLFQKSLYDIKLVTITLNYYDIQQLQNNDFKTN